MGTDDFQRAQARYESGIRDLTASVDLDWAAGRGHTVRVGGGAGVHRFTPGALSLVGDGEAITDTTLGATPTSGFDVSAYVEDEWRATPRLTLGLGLRARPSTRPGARRTRPSSPGWRRRSAWPNGWR